MKRTTRTVTAADQWSEPILVVDGYATLYVQMTTGTTATLRLQVRPAGINDPNSAANPWIDAVSVVNASGLVATPFLAGETEVRVGCKTGEFTSGVYVCTGGVEERRNQNA